MATTILARYLQTRLPQGKLLSVFDVGSNNLNYALIDAENGEVKHTAQLSTGLGREYRGLANGQIRVPPARLADFKRRAKELLEVDRSISSRKVAIATGIHRRLAQERQVADWFQRRWQIEYRVISEKQELNLAHLAAQPLIPPGSEALIIDIGGFSTELIISDVHSSPAGLSLPLGLLTLRKAAEEGLDVEQMIHGHLSALLDFQPQVVIGIGLAATFLAKVAHRERLYHPRHLHGVRISREELLELEQHLFDDNGTSLMPYSVESDALPVLRLSTRFFSLLLDRFGALGFLVCYYGISTSYRPVSRHKGYR